MLFLCFLLIFRIHIGIFGIFLDCMLFSIIAFYTPIFPTWDFFSSVFYYYYRHILNRNCIILYVYCCEVHLAFVVSLDLTGIKAMCTLGAVIVAVELELVTRIQNSEI